MLILEFQNPIKGGGLNKEEEVEAGCQEVLRLTSLSDLSSSGSMCSGALYKGREGGAGQEPMTDLTHL